METTAGKQKLTEGDKTEPAKGKSIAKVSQKYIDMLLHEKATSTGMYGPSKFTKYVEDYECSVDLQPFVACLNAIREQVRAGDAAILEQYNLLSYAYDEMEDESFVNDEKVCAPLARTRPLPLPA